MPDTKRNKKYPTVRATNGAAKEPSLYELANEVIRKSGVDDPESLSEEERFLIVMSHLVRAPKIGK